VGQIAGGDLEIFINKDKSSKELLDLSSGISKMKDSIREKINDIETINTSYERFVPKEFLTLLKKDAITDVNIGDSTSLKMGVLFSDMRNFTGISEKMSPEENFKFLNKYLEFMTPAIKKYNGFIDKYVGDAVMALFPTSAEDAVLAAVEMNKQLAVYNSDGSAPGQDPVNMGVGIHIGQLVLGTIGRETRMETTVISDTVNASARLENLNKTYKTSVLISGAVRDELSPEIQSFCRLIDRTQVKGKVEFLDVYEVYLADDTEVAEAKSKSKKVLSSIVDNYFRGKIEIAKKKLVDLKDETKKDSVISFWKDRLTT